MLQTVTKINVNFVLERTTFPTEEELQKYESEFLNNFNVENCKMSIDLNPGKIIIILSAVGKYSFGNLTLEEMAGKLTSYRKINPLISSLSYVETIVYLKDLE